MLAGDVPLAGGPDMSFDRASGTFTATFPEMRLPATVAIPLEMNEWGERCGGRIRGAAVAENLGVLAGGGWFTEQVLPKPHAGLVGGALFWLGYRWVSRDRR